VSGSGSGDPRDSSADLSALPPEIAKQSISPARVMLPFDAALEAIRFLTERDRRVESWEGWVRLTDGSRAKSLTHGGSFALSRDPARAAESASAGIRRAHEHWERNPEYPGAALYFGITFGDAKSPT
jgi:hypothetical protein